MLKKTIILLVIFIALSFSVKQSANAQLKYGAGIFYGTWLNNPGLNLRAEFDIADALVAVPKIDISIPRISTGTFLNSVSLHLHYNFDITEEISIYPLAGVALKSYLDFDSYGNNRLDHRFGVNGVGGAGGQYRLTDTFVVFAEGRLEIGRYSQFVSTVGVLMTPGG